MTEHLHTRNQSQVVSLEQTKPTERLILTSRYSSTRRDVLVGGPRCWLHALLQAL